MTFKIASSPHLHIRRSTHDIMQLVILACIPGILVQAFFFGWGNLVHIAIAIVTALMAEALILHLRSRPIKPVLMDFSALLTAVLIGTSVPTFAPWWITVIGTGFAILVVKQLYGGLGFNLFNPAMAGYVLLLISFPVEMTAWLPPQSIVHHQVNIGDAFAAIFTGYTLDGYSVAQLRTTIDGMTMATPLDTLKTGFTLGLTSDEITTNPVFGSWYALGWEWVNLAYLAGGLFLLKMNVIRWQIPIATLGSLFLMGLLGYMILPDSSAGPLFHMLTGATMLGAFFIATDPVSASTTNLGRLIYGAFIGLMVFVIRTWGGYPDAFAFAVLLANMCVPLIDYYTRPRTYGYSQGSSS
ncbi:electron transport complex subunit RsxD [Algicola sagamiensis]|uniref:electron transport complex subunit RsxD n=1 Tax=Algicola sagamiensis TaxID=163869 RepID=UPI00039A0D8C|nr:electron transport complex subunit RsxD [Algicola sagamiensis]